MKTAFKILAGLTLLVILAVVLALWLTRGLTEAGDAFIESVREGRTEQTLARLSEGFRAVADEAALSRFLDDSGIRRAVSASWHSRSIQGAQGRLEGTLTTASGGRVPIAIDLVKEDGMWKVHRIEHTAPGPVQAPVQIASPSTEVASALVRQTTLDFVESLSAGSMAHFHASTSALWQSQHAVDDLDSAYRVFLDMDADFSVLNRLTPRLDAEPTIDDRGVLTVSGHYATEPSRVSFSYRYVREDGAWKPLGVELNITQMGND